MCSDFWTPKTQLAISGVAVEKLRWRKRAKITSRQDALRAICRKRLTIYHPPNRAVLVNIEFFNSHRPSHSANSPVERFSEFRVGLSATRTLPPPWRVISG